MDRANIFLVGLPIFLFFSDIVTLFAPPPPKPTPSHRPHHHVPQAQYLPKPHTLIQQPMEFPTQRSGAIGIGHTINIDFCTSCSYRGTAVTMKNMLETAFPGINVILGNHPPPLPKQLLSKLVPVVQVGMMATIVAGEHIFPRLGMTPPIWYYNLRANRFGSIMSTWLIGNFFQSFLQSSGGFEVSLNGELVFSKLKQHRFPGEIELRDLVGQRLALTKVA